MVPSYKFFISFVGNNRVRGLLITKNIHWVPERGLTVFKIFFCNNQNLVSCSYAVLFDTSGIQGYNGKGHHMDIDLD